MIGCWRILHTESATGWGGQQIRILEESSGMVRRGHSVVIACRPDTIIARRAAEWNVPVVTSSMNGAFDIVGIQNLRALIQDYRPHIVNTHSSRDSWTGLIAAKLAGGAATIRTRHDHANIKGSFDSRLLYCKLSDAITTTGEAIREYVIERTGSSPDRVVSIPTGIDIQKFDLDNADGSAFRQDIGILNGDPLIGTATMFVARKGLSYFVDAAVKVTASVPNARFVIVGDKATPGDWKPKFVEKIEELGMQDKIILAGYRSDMPNVIAGIDVFVLASVSEGLPQVITQALAMKRPVVATSVGAIPEQVIDGKTGYLVERADPDQLADAILRMLADRDKARQMGENGRRLVEKRFDIEAMLDVTEDLYRTLIPKTMRP